MNSFRYVVAVAVVFCAFHLGCSAPDKAAAQTSPQSPSTPVSNGDDKTDGDKSQRILVPEDLKALKWRSVGPANMSGRVALGGTSRAETGCPS